MGPWALTSSVSPGYPRDMADSAQAAHIDGHIQRSGPLLIGTSALGQALKNVHSGGARSLEASTLAVLQ
jgi:hypothetical protein